MKKRFGEKSKSVDPNNQNDSGTLLERYPEGHTKSNGGGDYYRKEGGSRRREEVVVFLKNFGELEADVFLLFFLEKHKLGVRRLVPSKQSHHPLGETSTCLFLAAFFSGETSTCLFGKKGRGSSVNPVLFVEWGERSRRMKPPRN